MKIKTLHYHCLISTENYNNERVGFSVELEPDETPELVIPLLRKRARLIIARRHQDDEEIEKSLHELQAQKNKIERDISILTNKWRQAVEESDLFCLETDREAIEDIV